MSNNPAPSSFATHSHIEGRYTTGIVSDGFISYTMLEHVQKNGTIKRLVRRKSNNGGIIVTNDMTNAQCIAAFCVSSELRSQCIVQDSEFCMIFFRYHEFGIFLVPKNTFWNEQIDTDVENVRIMCLIHDNK